MKKVALRFHLLNTDGLITFAREVRDEMLASADVFTNPAVSMTDLGNLITALQAAQQNVRLGGKPATAHRNEKRRLLKDALRELANYVENVAKGDVEIIYLAGMDAARQGPRRYESLNVPANVRTVNKSTGVVTVRWNKVHNAKAYMVEYCLDPITDAGWQTGNFTSTPSVTISGLTRLRDYWFRVRAIGTESMVSDWSAPAKQAVV